MCLASALHIPVFGGFEQDIHRPAGKQVLRNKSNRTAVGYECSTSVNVLGHHSLRFSCFSSLPSKEAFSFFWPWPHLNPLSEYALPSTYRTRVTIAATRRVETLIALAMAAFMRTGTDAPQARGFVLIAKWVVTSRTAASIEVISAATSVTSTVWFIALTGSGRQTEFLFFISTIASSVAIGVFIADSGIPRIVLQPSARASTTGIAAGTVATGFFICAPRGALVSELGKQVADPFDGACVARGGVVGRSLRPPEWDIGFP